MHSDWRASRSSVAASEIVVDEEALVGNDSAASTRAIWQGKFRQGGGIGDWRSVFTARIRELALRGENWDSYGGMPLHAVAVRSLAGALLQLEQFINSAPSIALTPSGGLISSWSGSDYTLEIESDEAGNVSVYFCDSSMGAEHDVLLSEATDVEKWTWQASTGF